jgi:NADH:ubiquinone oxidoreductase subunit D
LKLLIIHLSIVKEFTKIPKMLNYIKCLVENLLKKLNYFHTILIKFQHFKFYTNRINIDANDTYLETEAPIKYSLVVYRCKIKAPGFAHLRGLTMMSKRSYDCGCGYRNKNTLYSVWRS